MTNEPAAKAQPEKHPKAKKTIHPGRIIGYGFIILGMVSIIDFFSPIPIPTTGGSAVLSGLLFAAVGAVLLVPNKMDRLKKIIAKLSRSSRPRADIDPLVPVKILKLARERRGVLTQAEVAVELTLSLAEAEAGLNACVESGHAAADFDMEREIKYYRFQEYLPPPAASSAPPGPE